MKRLLSVPSEPELAESENNFDNERLKKIRKEFNESRYKFSISKIRKSLYEIENKKNLSKSKILKIEKNLNKLEKSLFKPKKYYDEMTQNREE